MSARHSTVLHAAIWLAALLAATDALAATDGFLENRGQLDPRVRYHAETAFGGVFVTDEAIVLDLREPPILVEDADGALPAPLRHRGCAVYLGLDPAVASRPVTARLPLPGRHHYLTGADPGAWRTDVRRFAEVTVAEAWPGRDLVLRLQDGVLHCETASGKDGAPAPFAFTFAGTERAVPLAEGGWLLETPRGSVTIRLDGPAAALVTVTIPADRPGPAPAASATLAAGAAAAAAAKAAGVLVGATYLGGVGTDQCDAVALDPEGRPVLCGFTTSSDFPSTPGAYDETYAASYDVWTAKLDRDGETLLWSTFVGASGEERARGVAVDADGDVLVSGYTTSSWFPTTPGVFDETYNGGRDMFALKLDGGGGTLLWSTYVGGGLDESTMAMDLDPSGNPVLAGYTGSTDYPTSPGAYDESYNGPLYDAFVTVLDGDDGTMHASTYLGALGRDVARAVGADATGAVIVAGFADNGDFPVTPGSHDQTFNGGYADAVVSKLSADLATLEWSTFLGGDGDDRALALDLDTAGDPVLTGITDSTDLPTTPGVVDSLYNHSSDVFVARLAGADGTLTWATYLGAYYSEAGHGLHLDPEGNPVVVGQTGSAGFPVTPDAWDPVHHGSNDVFLAKLSPTGTELLYGTLLGGAGNDDATAVTVAADGRVTLIGTTGSVDFPVFPAAHDTTHAGGIDGIMAVLAFGDTTPPGPAADLAATGGHGTVTVAWTDPADPDLAVLEVWRSLWHDGEGGSAYPEYDDRPGQILPARPASREEALASPDWALVDSIAPGVGVLVDSLAVRGLYQHEVFPLDAGGLAGPPAASGARALSYVLGDLVGPDGPADGVVDSLDVVLLGAAYGAAGGDTAFDPELDVGPTDDLSGTGIPGTDGALDFEDLMIAAQNHVPAAGGTAGADGPEPVSLRWSQVGHHLWALVLQDGHPDLKGLRLVAALPAGSVQVTAGTLLVSQAAPVFLQNIDARGLDAGCALLGAGQVIDGAGEILVVQLPPGVSPATVSAEARGRAGVPLAVELDTVTGVPALPPLRLAQNHPNPFNPATTIRYAIPAAGHVRLEVLDLSGSRVAVLVDGPRPAGEHAAVWDGRNDRGRGVASGPYLYRLQARGRQLFGKMILLK